MDTASGRYPCDAPNCDQSSCAAIKNNYDSSTRTFKAPSAIKRADGSDALRPREPKVYNAPYQISNQDRERFQLGAASQQQQQQQGQPSGQEGEGDQQQGEGVTPAGQQKKSRRTRPRTQVTTPIYDQQGNVGDQGQPQQEYYQPGNTNQFNFTKKKDKDFKEFFILKDKNR